MTTTGIKWQDKAAGIYSQHPDWNSGQIYRELKEQLGESNVPTSLNTVQKWRQKGEPNMRAIQATGLDTPWHLGLMTKYNIPPEAVPYIDLVQDWLEKYPDTWGNLPPPEPTYNQTGFVGQPIIRAD